jgi:RNA polymerase sigma factor (sigma-70 family)
LSDSNAHISDQQLLDNFNRDHDNYWLGILFQRYTLLLYGVSMKYLKNEEEAKDSVQQVFLKAITELHKYPVQYFKSWLYMVTKNHCLMRIREKQGKAASEINDQQIADETDISSVQQHIEKDRQLELMTESLEELNSEQKLCVTLFYLEKKSYQDISVQTGFLVMQVKSYIQNGKRNLKLLMEKKTKIK